MLRKTTVSFLLATIALGGLFGLLSCSQGGDAYLEIDTASPKAYLIPADTTSCAGRLSALQSSEPASADVTGKYFSVRGLKFHWTHAYNSLTISLIRLRFTNDNITGGTYTCNISGDELSALQYTTPAPYVPWTATISKNADAGNNPIKTTEEMNCDIRCGGIETKEVSFTASGRIQVIGYMTDPSGEQIPINATLPFSIENLN